MVKLKGQMAKKTKNNKKWSKQKDQNDHKMVKLKV